LSNALSQIPKQVNYVVLLSQLDLVETSALVNQFDRIDIAISHERRDHQPVEQSGTALVMPCGTKASNLELMKLAKSNAATATILESEPIDLGDSVPHNAAIDQLITESYSEKLMAIRRLRELKKQQELQKSLMDGLNKTPEEFIKEQREKNREMESKNP